MKFFGTIVLSLVVACGCSSTTKTPASPGDKALCEHSLKNIHTAILMYQTDQKTLPKSLSDAYPKPAKPHLKNDIPTCPTGQYTYEVKGKTFLVTCSAHNWKLTLEKAVHE